MNHPPHPGAGAQSLRPSATRAAMLGGQSASRGPAAPACSLPELLEESQNMTVTHIPSSEHSMLAATKSFWLRTHKDEEL